MSFPKSLIIDSSVAVKWLNSQEENDISSSDKILKDAQDGKIKLFAPELSKYEIGNALLNKKITIPEASISLSTLFSTPITFMEMDEEEASNTFEIAYKYGITYYDASFVSLASKLQAVLVTANPKHQKGISEVKVISLKDY